MTNEINTTATWIFCPYCGESFETFVDCSAGSQSYIEDCEVCCRPIECEVITDPGGEFQSLNTRRDDE